MSVVIPSIEVERLKVIIIKNFCYQFKRRIPTATSFLNFIEARTETTCGIELKTIIENRNFKIRVYVQGFDNKEIFRPFRLESVINNSPGPQDEVWVAYVILPRLFFPALSKVRNQIPRAATSNVERPIESSLLGSTPSIYRSIEYFYLTSQLYPVRGDEGFKSEAYVADLHTPETIMPEDELTITADISFFTLGAVEDPIVNGYIYKLEDTSHQEKLYIEADVTDFSLIQTFFPPEIINIIYKIEEQTDENYHDDLSIVADITDFSLTQTFFPPTIIDIRYKLSIQTDENYHDDLSITADITFFSLTVTAP